ncbi:MAG TPA: hypothetical protein VGM06_18820 [Polyangiaceae bacterium]
MSVEAPLEPAPESGPASPSFAAVLGGLDREISDGDAQVRSAVGALQGGADFDPARLIALQAGVYRYSEVLDLASRLVDRATAGVKTVVQAGGQ